MTSVQATPLSLPQGALAVQALPATAKVSESTASETGSSSAVVAVNCTSPTMSPVSSSGLRGALRSQQVLFSGNAVGRAASMDLSASQDFRRAEGEAVARKEISFGSARSKSHRPMLPVNAVPLSSSPQPVGSTVPRPTLLGARGPFVHLEDAASATSTIDSGTPLVAAQAALAAAEAALAREPQRTAGELPAALVEVVQRKLDEVVAGLNAERRSRDKLWTNVSDLEKRVSEGLSSISDVAAARMATDGATEAMLNAMRKCMDELGEQCAWPPDAPPCTTTLAGSVAQQVKLMGELLTEHRTLKAKLDGQPPLESQVAALLQAERREMGEALRAVAEQQLQLRAMQEQLLAVAAGGCAGFGKGAEALEAAVRALEAQLGHLQGDNGQLAQVIAALKAQQDTLAVAQQSQEEVLQSMLAVLQGHSHESAQHKERMDMQTQEMSQLRGDIAALETTVAALLARAAATGSGSSSSGAASSSAAAAPPPPEPAAGEPGQPAAEVPEPPSDPAPVAAAAAAAARPAEQAREADPAVDNGVGTLVKLVHTLAERIDRIDRGHKEPLSEVPEAASEDHEPEVPNHQAPHSALAISGYPTQGVPTVLATAPAVPQAARGRRCVGSAAISSSCPPQRADMMNTLDLSFLKAPSPRKWLAEPLSVLVARPDRTAEGEASQGARPTSLQVSV